ncbi:hypothetical protein CLOSTASPAR_00573 [[Clostridium] asparagiforme DSM 15981]|uniref:Uncharacterized protein n=1 Tax=[Clostridium] asparagiforme DSM 15981 TaxID=518636 RepID=C0CUC3_9FIRM|nr:hypothetical protein CLOSTASPAR_00573 [[Clostridium] asparagiforme DSM 15981]
MLHLAISFPDQKTGGRSTTADSLFAPIIVLCAPEKVNPLIPG